MDFANPGEFELETEREGEGEGEGERGRRRGRGRERGGERERERESEREREGIVLVHTNLTLSTPYRSLRAPQEKPTSAGRGIAMATRGGVPLPGNP